MKKNSALKKFMTPATQRYFPWILGIAGVAAMIYGVLFQTEFFTLVPFIYCLCCFMIGCMIGLMLMRHACSMNNVHLADIENMMPGYDLTGFLCLLIIYYSNSYYVFMIGVGAFGLAVSCIWYYLFYRSQQLNKAKEKE